MPNFLSIWILLTEGNCHSHIFHNYFTIFYAEFPVPLSVLQIQLNFILFTLIHNLGGIYILRLALLF